MKGRSGFVSNSSTASFVLLGFDASRLLEENIDAWEDDRFYNGDGDALYECLNGSEGGCPPGVDLVIGKYLFLCSSDSYAESTVEILQPYLDEVYKLKDKLGVRAPIRLWSGTRGC